jgi:hypothetical protein
LDLTLSKAALCSIKDRVTEYLNDVHTPAKLAGYLVTAASVFVVSVAHKVQ